MSDGAKLDLFVAGFRMCHHIPMGEGGLTADHSTAPVAEFVLTKAQIVHLTQNDATDLIAMLSIKISATMTLTRSMCGQATH